MYCVLETKWLFKTNAGEKETTIYLSAITVRFSEFKHTHI
jgi:hypothetical protein